jgi:formate hydrogenlyase subunit 6/NADH:ubiquinone oxidoreductase subunit I
MVVEEGECINGCHLCVEWCPVDCLAINPAVETAGSPLTAHRLRPYIGRNQIFL